MGTGFDLAAIVKVRTFGVRLRKFTAKASWIWGEHQSQVSERGAMHWSPPEEPVGFTMCIELSWSIERAAEQLQSI